MQCVAFVKTSQLFVIPSFDSDSSENSVSWRDSLELKATISDTESAENASIISSKTETESGCGTPEQPRWTHLWLHWKLWTLPSNCWAMFGAGTVVFDLGLGVCFGPVRIVHDWAIVIFHVVEGRDQKTFCSLLIMICVITQESEACTSVQSGRIQCFQYDHPTQSES